MSHPDCLILNFFRCATYTLLTTHNKRKLNLFCGSLMFYVITEQPKWKISAFAWNNSAFAYRTHKSMTLWFFASMKPEQHPEAIPSSSSSLVVCFVWDWADIINSGNKSKEWWNAISEEITYFLKNGTWSLVPLYRGMHLRGCKWAVFIKRDLFISFIAINSYW